MRLKTGVTMFAATVQYPPQISAPLRAQGRDGNFGSKAFFQRVWIATCVINSQNRDLSAFDSKKDAVLESRHSCPPDGWRCLWESLGLRANLSKQFFLLFFKFLRKPWISFLKLSNRFGVIEVGGRPDVEPFHFRPKRIRVSSRSCSQEIPSVGSRRNSSARRSSSAICAAVSFSSAPPNSIQICSASSCCSDSGRRRICSSISAVLIRTSYFSIWAITWPSERQRSGCARARSARRSN